jgi:hypothetical protein
MSYTSYFLALCLTGTSTAFADPCESGLKLGQRPGPYSFNVATGPKRGQQTCYVCSTGDKPAIVIFSRKPSEALGKLITKCDAFVLAQPKDTVQAWMTVLGEKTISLDELAKWSKNAGIKTVPVGVFDDPVGPPTYKLNADAEVTVLLWVNRKVIANFAFRATELDDAAIKKVVDAFPKLIEKK